MITSVRVALTPSSFVTGQCSFISQRLFHFLSILLAMPILPIKLDACPRGYFGDPTRPCTCSSTVVTRDQRRIFDPLMDWIDIHMQVPRVEFQKLRDMKPGESSAAFWVRREVAQECQQECFIGSALICIADFYPCHGAPMYTPLAIHRSCRPSRSLIATNGYASWRTDY